MKFKLLAAAWVALSCAVAGAQPAAYPAKPVNFVVAFAPAGPADIIARLIGQKLSERLGQPVVVNNRGGAGGSIATRAVAKSEPDGYTVLVNTSAYAVTPYVSKQPGYDPRKDLIPVVAVATSPNLIVASPKFKARNLKEVIELAKTQSLNYGTAGAGTTPHLDAEYLFKVLAGVNVMHIPYKGAGPALAAALGGDVELASVAMPPAVPLVKAGQLRPLAVTSSKRSAALPDVPTVAESGFAGFEDYTWVGLFVPAGTPPAIVSSLNAAVTAVLAGDEIKTRLAEIGFEPMGGTSASFAKYLDSELDKWSRIIKATGIVPE